MKTLKKAVMISVVMLIVCGLIYPLAMTGISQIAFGYQAKGSLIEINGKAIGSEHIGQAFTDERFFHGRPSAVNYNTYTLEDLKLDEEGNAAYGGVGSGSQNLAPSNPALIERVEADIATFLENNPTIKKEDIPTDLLTGSGSGLDPDISPAAAKVQIPRVAETTGISEEKVQEIVDKYTKSKVLGVFGEERVNVLQMNIEIAKLLDIV